MSDVIISNPQGPTAVAGIPASLSVFPLDPSSKNPVVREAKKLHDLAAAKNATLRTVRDAQGDAISALTRAKGELQELIVQGARSGQIDADAELEASLRVSASERLTDPSVHATRQRVAINEQKAAVADFHQFVAKHASELFETLRPEAEAATEALIEAEASIEAQRERHRAAQNAAQLLGAIVAGAVEGAERQALSQLLRFDTGPGAVPMPSDEALQRLTPRELVAVDDD